MTMTPQQLWDAALTLENDGEFYKEYTNYASVGTPFADGRRTIIQRAASRLNISCRAEDREQLRRYLDNSWQLPAARHGISPIQQARATLDTIEFWKDEVRFPTKEVAPMPAAQAPQPGAVYWKHTNWQGPNPLNHGAFYTSDDIDKMARMFYGGCNAPTIANTLGRKHNSIAAKLKELRLLTFSSETNTWLVIQALPSMEHFFAERGLLASCTGAASLCSGEYIKEYRKRYPDIVTFWDQKASQPSDITADPDLDAQPTHTKETIMTASIIEITTKTLINGQDISAMSDSVIYSTIANQEAEIEKLEKIKNKPKRLVAEIEKRQAGIKALVDFLDGKESKTA